MITPMTKLHCPAFVVLTWCAASAPSLAQEQAAASPGNPAAATFFTENVRPILEQHCYRCHSHQAKKAKGGLVLDSRSGWAKGGQSGPALVPGKPDKSLLISAVRHEDLEMPPQGKLPEKLVGQLVRWIADGAHDPRVTKSADREKRWSS